MVSRINPADFTLNQNFPNPFTQINYSVRQNMHVLLRIYDSNGSEITALVNENKVAGQYSINFNASDFASGIYYYTITAGSFTDTKKMILLK